MVEYSENSGDVSMVLTQMLLTIMQQLQMMVLKYQRQLHTGELVILILKQKHYQKFY